MQAHNQYRERHSIPFIEDICAIRGNYELPANKMSEVLGLGVNGYSNYEKGEIPTPAIGNLINTISDPNVFIGLLHRAKNIFTKNAYEKATARSPSVICISTGTNLDLLYSPQISSQQQIIEIHPLLVSPIRSEFTLYT